MIYGMTREVEGVSEDQTLMMWPSVPQY